MEQSKLDWIKISIKKHGKSLKGNFNSIEFVDHGSYIVFLPSLNLSSYGDTPQEAQQMMETSLKDWVENMMSLKSEEVITELKKHGWQQSPFFPKQLSRTAYINKEGVLKDFELPQDTEVKETLVTV